MSLRQCASFPRDVVRDSPRDSLRDVPRDQARCASRARDHCGAAGGPARVAALRSIGGRAGCVLVAAAPAAGRRDGVGACLAAGAEGGVEPVVSGGNAGSAFMMLTGGIEAADGKNKPLRPAAAVGGCASPSLPPAATA